MSKIFDNIGPNKFEDGLRAILSAAGVKRADFCVGYFNLRGWKSVAGEIDKLPGSLVKECSRVNGRERWDDVQRICRLLIGMYRPVPELIQELYSLAENPVDTEKARRWKLKVANDFRRQLTLGIPTAEDETTLQKLLEELKAGKVAVRLFLRSPLHAKLYLAHRPGDPTPVLSLMGSSNLTFCGMTRNGELNAEFADVGDTRIYDKWFNDRWNDSLCLDITNELIEVIEQSWASPFGPTPYEIYLKIVYHLSREARSGVSEYHLPPPFDVELFDFQKTAVQLAVRHLEKRGGAMIGDVVGLGKTITACAVAKFYEETLGASTLVLCPPNLQDMWRSYADKYDLKMAVRSIATKIDARKERYFKLVIIDESHNLRNSGGQRYANVKDLLAYQGNKVLLLTATPYNKDFSDIANQLKLFVDPELDLGIRPGQAIMAAGGEQAFSVANPDTLLSSLKAFERSFSPDDWRDLLKLYLVRRTRTFIKNNYALTDLANGRKYLEMKDGTRNYFPDRIPKSILFVTAPGDMFERLYCTQMIDWMGDLALPRYGLQKYIDEAAAATATLAEKRVLDNFSRAGKRMMGFCRSGFYKRMDSSGVAFLMSLYRHAVRNAMYLYALKKSLDLPVRTDAEIGDGINETDDGSGKVSLSVTINPKDYETAGKDAYDEIRASAPASVAWISPKYFKKSLATAIKNDNKIIFNMLARCGAWKPAEDEKLNELEKLVAQTHKDEKVLVFTQYSDTARYLAEQLKARGVTNLAQVDGDSENVVAEVNSFSPVSNKCDPAIPPARQTRVLIATDMLSEGQNLQDCHVIVNYDLPWAIIRLIQRAGRVDRIGQKNEEVFCYSFFPQEGINDIIRLRDRLNDRINANAEAVGSDEVFFDGNKQNLKDIFNEKAGILDEADDGEVDLASQAYQIWEKATRGNAKLRERIQSMPDVVYSTKEAGANPPGVIAYARTRNDNDLLTWVNTSGEVESQSPSKILQALACTASTPKLPPLPNHHALVRKAIENAPTDRAASGGTLGSKSSTKYRLFSLLQERLRESSMPLFEQNLKAAADQIFSYPLRETAKNALGKMFQKNIPADDIIQCVLELQRDNELCIVPDDEGDAPDTPRIICSMGLAQE